MRHEDRHFPADGCALGGGGGGQRQVARQHHQAGKPLAMAQSGLQCNRATLRKAGDDDAMGRYAAPDFARDQFLAFTLAGAHAGLVFHAHQVGQLDVVPGAHHHAAVDRDRAHRRMRKHEAHPAAQAGQGVHVEFLDDRYEVVAIGTQAVHPDHRRGRGCAGDDFNAFEQCAHGRAFRGSVARARTAVLGRKALHTAVSVSM